MGKKLTTQGFIEKARVRHGDRYDYAKTVYVNARNKLSVTCPSHGDFLQTPYNHLRGYGCSKCAKNKPLTSLEFITKARGVHKGRYSYDRVEYVNSSNPVLITCSTHGDFEQTPNNHMNGAGCLSCKVEGQTLTTSDFIRRSVEVHSGKYLYDNVDYVSWKAPVEIICLEHGIFEQSAGSHMTGRGCPRCCNGGFNPDRPAFVYFLLDTETHSLVKIGVSNSPDRRLQELKSRTPFSIDRIELFETPSEITLQIEALCHYQLESANLKGFDGATEWFKFDGGKLEALRAFILSFGGAAK